MRMKIMPTKIKVTFLKIRSLKYHIPENVNVGGNIKFRDPNTALVSWTDLGGWYKPCPPPPTILKKKGKK
jgi:hypothetical protein